VTLEPARVLQEMAMDEKMVPRTIL